MIGELTAKLRGCYRARRWYDLAIEAKDDEIKVGKALHQTARDRIVSLEKDIGCIKDKATARLCLPVAFPAALSIEVPKIAASGVVLIRDDFKEEPVKTVAPGSPGDFKEDPWWPIGPTPPPLSSAL